MRSCLRTRKGIVKELLQAVVLLNDRREKTHAHQYLLDDVPDDVKSRRLREVTETHHDLARSNAMRNVGSTQVVLVEGDSKR